MLIGAFASFRFLSVTDAYDCDYAVFEGWAPPYVAAAAAGQIEESRYSIVFSTGGPVQGTGPYSSDYNTSAHVGYTRLVAAGVSTKILRKVPCRVRDRDRTFSAAVALRDYFRDHDIHPKAINVITESVHARRSRLLFQKALGPDIRVGVISVPPSDYPADEWWKYSAGVKDVISEGAAYLYVRLFFWP